MFGSQLPSEPGIDRLSPREREVLLLIADGRSTKEIARELGITFKTACSHRTRVLEKLGVHNSVAAMRAAVRAGLLEA